MFEQSDDKTILNLIVQNCPVFYFRKNEKTYPIDVEQYLRKSQLKHLHNPSEVYCSSIQNLFLEKRYLINGQTRSPLSDKEFFLNPSSKIQMINTLNKSTLYARLTLNESYIRIVYFMFFPDEGQDEIENRGNWKHCALYFDKITLQLSYLVLGNHGKYTKLITSDAVNYEIISGNTHPILYIDENHSIKAMASALYTKRWFPKNIMFLPETLQRARRNKSCWIFYRGQYSPNKIYGPIHYKWWNYDVEFLEHFEETQEEFKTRQKRLEEINEVIDKTKHRVKSRTQSKSYTEVNRKFLRESNTKTLSRIRDTNIPQIENTTQIDKLLEQCKIEELEQQKIQLQAELETQKNGFEKEKEELKKEQQRLSEQIKDYQIREKSLIQRESNIEKEKKAISKMIQDSEKKDEHDDLPCDVKAHITQRSRELRELEKKLEETTQSLEEREKHIREREEEILEIIERIEESEKTNNDDKINTLEQTINKLKNENNDHQKEETRLHDEISFMQQEMKTIQETSTQSLNKVKEYTNEINHLTENLKNREKRIIELKVETEKQKKTTN